MNVTDTEYLILFRFARRPWKAEHVFLHGNTPRDAVAEFMRLSADEVVVIDVYGPPLPPEQWRVPL